MKIPESVTVGGKTFRVICPYQFTETELVGQVCNAVNEIRIADRTVSGLERTRENIEEVFIHELLHAVDAVYNANALDEATIERIGQGLYQALRDSGMLRDK